MSTVIKTEVFSFLELDEHAKERAREWMRSTIEPADCMEFVLDDFATIAKILGTEIDGKSVQLMGGGTRYEPVFYWDIDRGSYLIFSGFYKWREHCKKQLRAHAPVDSDLHVIVDRLHEAQRRVSYSAYTGITMGRECMRFHTNFDVEPRKSEVADDVARDIEQALQDFADWGLSQLRNEYDYQMSDEVVDGNILANEYTFTADGTRFG